MENKNLAKVSLYLSKNSKFLIFAGSLIVGMILIFTTATSITHAQEKRTKNREIEKIQELSTQRGKLDTQIIKNEQDIIGLQQQSLELRQQQNELSKQAKEMRIKFVQQYGCDEKPEWCDLLKTEVVQKIEFRTNSEGRAKPLPKVEPALQAFATEYGLDPQDFIDAGKEYNIKPEVILCIARADSDLGRALKSKNNIGNVGNNDRGDTREFATMRDGIFAIGQTLNNKYLGNKETIQDLSRYGNCEKDCQYIYASSPENRENNVMNCLNFLYGNI